MRVDGLKHLSALTNGWLMPGRLMAMCLVAVSLVAAPVQAKGTYYTLEQLLPEIFSATPDSQALWLNKDQKRMASDVLQRRFHKARVKYWRSGERYLWVLSEIGKEKPITFAVVTQAGMLERIEVMAFREIRGDEIRMPAYTAQFRDLTLTDEQKLSQSIDGISGATYSVRSMKKVAKLALLLDRWTKPGA